MATFGKKPPTNAPAAADFPPAGNDAAGNPQPQASNLGTRAVHSAQNLSAQTFHRILTVGSTGSGKTGQIWTLPGRKFCYAFDQAALNTLQGCPNLDVVEFLPEMSELDMSLKGFNKNSKSDKMAGKAKEPTLYLEWVEDLNARADAGFFDQYDWLCFDSLTMLISALMDRQLFLNNRYGDVEDIGDYRVVGSKFATNFRGILSMPLNIYCTGHTATYQDDKTQKIVTQLRLAGKARDLLPLMMGNIWFAEHGDEYTIRTKPDKRGFQDIRSSIRDLNEVEEVTIKDFANPTKYGIGKILTKNGFKTKS